MRWKEEQSGGAMGSGRSTVWGDGIHFGSWPCCEPRKGLVESASPELKPLFWGSLRPQPGSSAAYVHGVFEESCKAQPVSWGDLQR